MACLIERKLELGRDHHTHLRSQCCSARRRKPRLTCAAPTGEASSAEHCGSIAQESVSGWAMRSACVRIYLIYGTYVGEPLHHGDQLLRRAANRCELRERLGRVCGHRLQQSQRLLACWIGLAAFDRRTSL
jgi:hypothetical protein